MSLDMWFPTEVTRILASVLEVQQNAARITPLDIEYAAAYQCGFIDALRAVAVAFGLPSVPQAQKLEPNHRR